MHGSADQEFSQHAVMHVGGQVLFSILRGIMLQDPSLWWQLRMRSISVRFSTVCVRSRILNYAWGGRRSRTYEQIGVAYTVGYERWSRMGKGLAYSMRRCTPWDQKRWIRGDHSSQIYAEPFKKILHVVSLNAWMGCRTNAFRNQSFVALRYILAMVQGSSACPRYQLSRSVMHIASNPVP